MVNEQMVNYLDILAKTISENWDAPALTDFYLTEDGTAQDTSRGNHYTYGEMYCEMMRLGDMFRALGLKKGDHIAICGANSANWAVAYLAIAAYGGVVVTVLHSQSIEDIAHQIDFSDAVALFTDREIWEELREQNLPQVKHVIALDDWSIMGTHPSSDAANLPQPGTVEYPSAAFNERQSGDNQEKTLREELVNSKLSNGKLVNGKLSNGKSLDDLAMICFTSGSTGVSKGVMLSYKNLSANFGVSCDENLIKNHSKHKNTISILPLAHMYGLVTEFLYSMWFGKNLNITCQISSFQNYIKSFQLIKSCIILLVPSFLEKIVHFAEEHPEYGSIKKQFEIFFGNEVESYAVSGATLDKATMEIIVNCDIPLIIGYGLTECVRLAECTCKEFRTGVSGKLMYGVECNISPIGEILVKGDNVMLGYYKDPEATAQKIDKDGWLHTGDRGHLDEDGYLYIEGRLEQDIIVLPNGENIHPEDIENKINALPEVKESIVVAREGKPVALVVENPESQELPDAPESSAYRKALRLHILRTINPQLPLYSQLCDIEFLHEPLQRTAKQTIKRYLYS